VTARRYGAAAALALLLAVSARAQSPADPLAPFLRGLSDSTDACFGREAVAFDTTGVDSLIRAGGASPGMEGRKGPSMDFAPGASFHRATGISLSVGARLQLSRGSALAASGGYGFADRRGRYRLAVERVLWAGGPGDQAHRLRLIADYARETRFFAPEHVSRLESVPAALFTGADRQSVYESRGGGLRLRWDGESGGATLGWRSARDQAARAGGTRQLLAQVRRRLPFGTRLAAGGVFSNPDRWRGLLSAAHRLARGPLALDLQGEAGLAAHNGPAQDGFQLGGPLAVPSLGFGEETGNQLLLAKGELLHAVDVLHLLHLPHPGYLLFHPALFAQGAAAWAGDGSFDRAPPGHAWRGSAGFSLVHLPGIPSEETCLRLQLAWPLGRAGGATRFSISISPWHDLVPEL